MKRRHCLIAALLCLYGYDTQAQNDTIYVFEDEAEQLLETSDDASTANYDDELEELHERYAEPLNINTTTREELQQFPFLTDLQIENILSYLYQHGEMQSLYELQLVKDMDWRTIRYLTAFFYAKPVVRKEPFPTLHELTTYGHHEAVARADIPLDRQEGYTKKKYLGPSYAQSLRYAWHYRDRLRAGFTAEKDKGEPFFTHHNGKGYDSYSAYLLINGWGRVKTLAAGDYRLHFGQGLIVSNSFLLGKSTYFSSLNRRGNSIRKHSSTDEQNFFRGLAAAIILDRRLTLSAFLSYRSMDGTRDGDSLTSIHTTGLHRTEKEADDRGSFRLLVGGSNISYEGSSYHVGITAIAYRFSHPYEPAYRKYSRYRLRGQNFFNAGSDYSYRLHRLSFTGETAVGQRGFATVNRLFYSPAQGYNIVLLHRYYAHNYWAYFANSFKDGSMVQNENGWFIAADVAPLRKVSFFAGADLVSFPWWRYRVSKPSKTADVLLRCTWTPTHRLAMDVNYRYQRKERDVTGTKGGVTRPTERHHLRCRMAYAVTHSLSSTTWADCCSFHQQGFDSSRGYQFTESVCYSASRLPLQCVAQGSYFHTDDYDSRVYIYERSMLYSFYIPSYQGTGIHLSLRLQCAIGRQWLVIVHGAHTRYYDRSSIGTGNDKIGHSFKSEVQMQVRWKL
jgi:hypothetical protein